MRKTLTAMIFVGLMTNVVPALAGQVEIVKVSLEKSINSWTVHVTLNHADTGWKHYADGWRVVDGKGKVLGHRTLYHPHVDEQPFTRSLSGIEVPAKTTVIYVEAHDKVHGWNKDRVRINLSRSSGKRYKIIQ